MPKIIQHKKIVARAKTMLAAHKNYPKVRKQMRGIVSVADLTRFTRNQDTKMAKAAKLRREADALEKAAKMDAGKINPRLIKSRRILRAHLKNESPKIYAAFVK